MNYESILNHKRNKLIACVVLLAMLSACTTKEADVLQAMFGGVWIAYVLTLIIVSYLAQQKVKDTFNKGAFLFVVASFVGPVFVKQGSIDPLSNVLLGTVASIMIVPCLLLYTLATYYVFRLIETN
jgi:hypothetical protein